MRCQARRGVIARYSDEEQQLATNEQNTLSAARRPSDVEQIGKLFRARSYGYGRIYTAVEVDAALRSDDPMTLNA
jgi:hypothetical protein